MNHTKKATLDPSRAHQRLEGVSGQAPRGPDTARGGQIAGLPWQLVLVLSVMVLGVLALILRGAGIL